MLRIASVALAARPKFSAALRKLAGIGALDRMARSAASSALACVDKPRSMRSVNVPTAVIAATATISATAMTFKCALRASRRSRCAVCRSSRQTIKIASVIAQASCFEHQLTFAATRELFVVRDQYQGGC